MAKKSVNSTEGENSASAPQNSFQAAIYPAKRFAQDSMRLVNRCTKPDAKEFKKIAIATTVGFLVMGFLGFFVKLVHIPSKKDRGDRGERYWLIIDEYWSDGIKLSHNHLWILFAPTDDHPLILVLSFQSTTSSSANKCTAQLIPPSV